jgi:hypothetical protein
MKRLPSSKAFLACSVLCVGVLIGAAVQAQPVNVGQVDGNTNAIPCMTPGEGTFVEFPELTLSLETQGRPVLIMFNVHAAATSDQAILLRPSIDGQSPDPFFVWSQSGSGQFGVRTLSFSRVYNVSKGTHIFGIQMSCQGQPTFLAGRWLTVYELR